MRCLIILGLSLLISVPAMARDNFVWGSYGGHQGYFDAPYYGFGFMAEGWGGHVGLIGRSDYRGGRLYYENPPHSNTTTIEQDVLTGLPVHFGVLRGYAPNESIALYASMGLLLSRYCDIEQSNLTDNRYCANERGNLDIIPGAGALFSLGGLTVGMSYQYGIGALISLGTDF